MSGVRTGRVGILAASWLAVAVAAMVPLGVAAKDGDVIRSGSCTASSDWKLKLSEEDGRIEVEFEVDQNRNGQTWFVKLKRDGTLFWSGQRTTSAPSGSFEVRKVINDGPGSDLITARARHPGSAEVCRGSATFGAY